MKTVLYLFMSGCLVMSSYWWYRNGSTLHAFMTGVLLTQLVYSFFLESKNRLLENWRSLYEQRVASSDALIALLREDQADRWKRLHDRLVAPSEKQ